MLLGQGFKPTSAGAHEYDDKWGVVDTSQIPRNAVRDYKYYFSSWLTYEKGNLELSSYQYEASNFNRVDSKITDGVSYNTVSRAAPSMINNHAVNGLSYTFAEDGGPFYVEVGRKIDIETVEVFDQ